MSEDTANEIMDGRISDLEQMVYDIRELVVNRKDYQEVIKMLANNDIIVTNDFCRRKRPSPTPPPSPK